MPTTFTDPKTRHPIIDDDRVFFMLNPKRKLRLRPYVKGEFGLDNNIALYAADDEGYSGEVNITVVRQIYPGCRIRVQLYSEYIIIDDTNAAITAFITSRGYKPDLKPLKINKKWQQN